MNVSTSCVKISSSCIFSKTLLIKIKMQCGYCRDNFIFWCVLTGMWILDLQYYISIDTCSIGFCHRQKDIISWQSQTFLLPSFTSVAQFFKPFSLLSLQCWVISIYLSSLPELSLMTSLFQCLLMKFVLTLFWPYELPHYHSLCSSSPCHKCFCRFEVHGGIKILSSITHSSDDILLS